MKEDRFLVGRRMAMAGAGAVLVSGGKAMAAAPLPVPPGGKMGFKVLRNGSPIGEQHLQFTQDGDALTVQVNGELNVFIAGIKVFHYTLNVVERWTGGSFTSLDSYINHNGTPREVHARPIQGGFSIQSTKAGNYDYTGPQPLLPLTYWNKAILNAMILNVETGHYYPPTVNSPGWNNLPTANGGTLLAQRFDITGQLHLSVWYDQQNQWSGLEFHVDGDETFQKIVA